MWWDKPKPTSKRTPQGRAMDKLLLYNRRRDYEETLKELEMLEHQCKGITCSFPGCLNNPTNNSIRHRAGLRRMTLAEFRKKYGTNGVSEILTYLIEHIPLSEKSQKDFKEIAADIKSLLQED